MTTRARIGGHPIHPMLVSFPIALWIFSLVADVIYLGLGNPIWRDWIAFYTLVGGIVGAVGAAFFGFIDWLTIQNRTVKSVADWHARLNVIALLIFVASFYLRTTNGSHLVGGGFKIPFGLSVVGVILINISAWLGGELTVKYGMGLGLKSQ